MSGNYKLFGSVNAQGYAPGETAETFRAVHIDTLHFVAENARSETRRNLAIAEIERRERGA